LAKPEAQEMDLSLRQTRSREIFAKPEALMQRCNQLAPFYSHKIAQPNLKEHNLATRESDNNSI
jgi:hypothetical protein